LASCNNTAAPFALPGNYSLRLAEGALLPTLWDPIYGSSPYTYIRSGQLVVTASDSMFLTIELELQDGSGAVVDSFPAGELQFSYALVGDSIVATGYPSMLQGGKIVGSKVRVVVDYPIPPSTGASFGVHHLEFVK